MLRTTHWWSNLACMQGSSTPHLTNLLCIVQYIKLILVKLMQSTCSTSAWYLLHIHLCSYLVSMSNEQHLLVYTCVAAGYPI
jgi:hypothetical protein